MSKTNNSRRVNHYTRKASWHKKNASLACKLFNYCCQNCGEDTIEKEGVIHHFQYTGNDYEKTIEKLLEDEAITWLCKTCHQLEHTAFRSSEVEYKFKHSGFCALCKKFSWHGWYKLGRGRIHPTYPSEYPLCDTCISKLIRLRILAVDEKEIGGYKGKSVNRSHYDDSLSYEARFVLNKLTRANRKGVFGSIELFRKKNRIQKSLFD